jgi:hypothetical protein
MFAVVLSVDVTDIVRVAFAESYIYVVDVWV